MPVFVVLGVLVTIYVAFWIVLFVYAGVQALAGRLRGHTIDREQARMDQETMRTVRQIDELTERGVAAMMAAAMGQRLRDRKHR